MYDDMLRELEVAEEEEEPDRDEEGEDASISTPTPLGEGGRQRSPLSTLSTLRHIDSAIRWDHVLLCSCLAACMCHIK